jgi:hypothetical protein
MWQKSCHVRKEISHTFMIILKYSNKVIITVGECNFSSRNGRTIIGSTYQYFDEPIIIAMKLHVIVGMSIHPRNWKDKNISDKIDTETKDYKGPPKTDPFDCTSISRKSAMRISAPSVCK